jgi:hypothetical protein
LVLRNKDFQGLEMEWHYRLMYTLRARVLSMGMAIHVKDSAQLVLKECPFG